jgi:hypothetical protein
MPTSRPGSALVFCPVVMGGKHGTSIESYESNELQYRSRDDEEVVQSRLANYSKAYVKSEYHSGQTQNLLL